MFDITSERYMSCNNSTIMVRAPNVKQKNFHKSKVKEAVEYRDKICKSLGLDPYSKKHSQNGRKHIKSHADKSCNLPVGVCLSSYVVKLADGSEQTYQRVIAEKSQMGKVKQKSFSVMKYGMDKAVALATAWRNQTN
ncbi:hypothetical protein [Shewanella xiamenensis]|uniref:hypothetical protein n=1 Tax=Shewanella xiamenensis TaxID=332186 RepID=UPI001CC6785B|nr:hypothetical protein [Shewanella xiamenensis]BDA63081.1 hypothetical protein NUITMVS1_45440 [Shewanella xiamenensis]